MIRIVSKTFDAAARYANGRRFVWVFRAEQLRGLRDTTIVVLAESTPVDSKIMDILADREGSHKLNIIFEG